MLVLWLVSLEPPASLTTRRNVFTVQCGPRTGAANISDDLFGARNGKEATGEKVILETRWCVNWIKKSVECVFG